MALTGGILLYFTFNWDWFWYGSRYQIM